MPKKPKTIGAVPRTTRITKDRHNLATCQCRNCRRRRGETKK